MKDIPERIIESTWFLILNIVFVLSLIWWALVPDHKPLGDALAVFNVSIVSYIVGMLFRDWQWRRSK